MQTIQTLGLGEVVKFLEKQEINLWDRTKSQASTMYSATMNKFFVDLIKRTEFCENAYEIAEYGLSVSKAASRCGGPYTLLNLFDFELPHKEVIPAHPLVSFYNSLEQRFEIYQDMQRMVDEDEQYQLQKELDAMPKSTPEQLQIEEDRRKAIENEERQKGIEELIRLVR